MPLVVKGYLFFSAKAWADMSTKEQEKILSGYRLAYLSKTKVNWCPTLGTVLANDEVQDGVSERGGYPVEQKEMLQWQLRITAYADRLLDGLTTLDWPTPIKEIQRNWIGKSAGAEVFFALTGELAEHIKVFTTRLDTLFGVTYLALAPEHPLVDKLIDWQKHNKADVQQSIAPMSNAYWGIVKKGLDPISAHNLCAHFKKLAQYVTYAKNLNERARVQATKGEKGFFYRAVCFASFYRG